jgi:hypothetical protein
MTELKTFDPTLDGGIQDDCGCDKEYSHTCKLNAVLGKGICGCVCHLEIHEFANKRLAEVTKELKGLQGVTRDRYGPAGYRVMNEVARARGVLDAVKENIDRLNTVGDADFDKVEAAYKAYEEVNKK